MNFINALTKFISQVLNPTEKEVKKMKKILIVTTLVLFTVVFGLVPANAAPATYTVIGSTVSVTATGSLTGTVTNMSLGLIVQNGTTVPTKIDFGTATAGVVNSGSALQVTGGTADVDSRIIIYTDNDSLFSTGHNPSVESGTGKPTGLDGAGMPGTSEAAYVVPLLWGLTSGSDFDPNTNPAYTGFTASDLSGGTNCVYVTDLRHNYDFVTSQLVADINARLGTTYTADEIDALALYYSDGSSGPTNTATEGAAGFPKLVPTLFKYSLYDSANTATHKVIREALYRNIATIAYSIRMPDPSKSDETGYYICNTAKLTTSSGSDNVRAKLAKQGTGTTDAYLYVPIGANFTGFPWQTYTTTKLTVAMVKG